MHLYRRSSKATDGTSQPHDRVQQLLNLHGKMFYKLWNKILLRLMEVPFKIKNHSKKRICKAVSSFSYTKQHWLLQKSMYLISITQISQWKGMNQMFQLKTMLKINQYYFLRFPIWKVNRKGYKSNWKFLEASLIK